ncbi:DUF5333 domain-containing protein [Oceaniglobus ichthyenteri]|uniref:DUF5333 domain-containing protein n=1 Tax=Oceaniglobus ichthyenteri TaxID=2136177 RepID=UPI000D3CCC45|nr:DUF5333 domain-containing protein [Oceaniglobus ichthyenteri]
MSRFLTSAALCATLAFPVAAQALPPINKEPQVYAMFYALGLADEVRKNCPTISPRMIRAFTYLKSIESYARKVGYTETQIRDLAENKAEKEKLRAIIRADLAKRGAKSGSPEGFCQVGREEIAKNSASGRLLKEN